MKLAFIAFSLLIVHISVAQDCRTNAANKAGTISRGLDAFVGNVISNKKPASLDISKMKPALGKIESWIRNLLTGFTGAKVMYSNDYYFDHEHGGWVGDFYRASGIKSFYGATTRFFAYYCYDNNNTIQTEAESGSFVHVNFNNVFASQLTQDVGVHIVNGKPAFRVLEKDCTEGRTDFYDLRKKMNVNDNEFTSKVEIIIIRNSDKPVFIPVTRKEYLSQMLLNVEAYRTQQKEFLGENYKNSFKTFEAEMKAYKLDKSYTAEKEAKRRKWFEEDQEKVDKVIKKIDVDVDASKEVISQYLDKPAEWLGRSLGYFFDETYTANALVAYFDRLDNFRESKEDYTRSEMATINPAYYNKALGTDVPQLVMIQLVKNGYRYMYKLADLIRKPGALSPIDAIVNPSQKTISTEIVKTESPSNYTVKYLPKLAALTPLSVPIDMKPSAIPVVNNYTSNPVVGKFSFEIPAPSPQLAQLPPLLTAETYKTYIQQLHTSISAAIQPAEKKKADDHVKNKKISQSKDIGKSAFAAWLQNAPKASLYLYSKAVAANPSDALTANNFAAFLMMGGLPAKSVPILEYWNKQKPREATLLCNLGNAYYRLGNMDKSMQYLQQCVQYDSLNATANKILCLMYLKKGDTKKAGDHGKASLTKSYDEQVVAVLRQLDGQVKPGDLMSRLHKNEFPLLKRARLPAMPSALDDMDNFIIELEAEKMSVNMTMESMQGKMGGSSNDALQKMSMQGLTGGIPLLRVKAQYIIMDAMQIFQKEKVMESDVFKHRLKILTTPYNVKVNAISKKYVAQLNKLEGGAAGDEDQIAALELARCKEINAETAKYLANLAPLVNGYAQRQEFIARKFYRDYANWAPYWMPQASNAFLSIQRDYLKDISSILSEYKLVTKSQCAVFEPEALAKKDGVLKEFEDEYCANFKGKLGLGPVEIAWTCNSWSVEGGEIVVGEFEMNFANDGSFDGFTIGGGLGETWSIGDGEVVTLEAGASIKEFIKIGRNKTSGKWEVNDFGIKTEGSLEGGIGNVTAEVKILELSVAVNAGLEVGGILAPIIPLK